MLSQHFTTRVTPPGQVEVSWATYPNIPHPLRFRSCLSSKFGVTNKQRPVAYSGRGRPPKGTVAMLGDVSSDEEEDPAAAMVTETGVGVSDKEYSEEDSDEEVLF